MQPLRECCQNPHNLLPPIDLGARLYVRLCRVCGAKHYTQYAEPYHFIVRLTKGEDSECTR